MFKDARVVCFLMKTNIGHQNASMIAKDLPWVTWTDWSIYAFWTGSWGPLTAEGKNREQQTYKTGVPAKGGFNIIVELP
ncbi:hypothetical protein CGLO_04517 [Colletotrichum gloeosporioides Cg-14]|uniref:Uncharacterized protein n=1 Tax=Colletotrichum gloeosporioides (strain Cg-14) TaxID=1237896 RepID=T0LUU4_COLGC|nr:hypothetical protein CGLO_04517 [Colletotrichum gloeosporioides Cg-14]